MTECRSKKYLSGGCFCTNNARMALEYLILSKIPSFCTKLTHLSNHWGFLTLNNFLSGLTKDHFWSWVKFPSSKSSFFGHSTVITALKRVTHLFGNQTRHRLFQFSHWSPEDFLTDTFVIVYHQEGVAFFKQFITHNTTRQNMAFESGFQIPWRFHFLQLPADVQVNLSKQVYLWGLFLKCQRRLLKLCSAGYFIIRRTETSAKMRSAASHKFRHSGPTFGVPGSNPASATAWFLAGEGERASTVSAASHCDAKRHWRHPAAGRSWRTTLGCISRNSGSGWNATKTVGGSASSPPLRTRRQSRRRSTSSSASRTSTTPPDKTTMCRTGSAVGPEDLARSRFPKLIRDPWRLSWSCRNGTKPVWSSNPCRRV